MSLIMCCWFLLAVSLNFTTFLNFSTFLIVYEGAKLVFFIAYAIKRVKWEYNKRMGCWCKRTSLDHKLIISVYIMNYLHLF